MYAEAEIPDIVEAYRDAATLLAELRVRLDDTETARRQLQSDLMECERELSKDQT